MIMFVTHQNKEHQVEIHKKDGKLFVSFDGAPETPLDLLVEGQQYSLIHENQVLTQSITSKKGQYLSWRPELVEVFEVETEYRRIVKAMKEQNLENLKAITAKMPGKILSLRVKEGDEVQKGQIVLIMEAMKMENEIVSSLSGRIASIPVKIGDTVENGDPLVELE